MSDLAQELQNFTGTEHWYRHSLNRNMLYTDGVQYFAEKAGAYWLLDIIATELHRLQQVHGFLTVTAESLDSKATLQAHTEVDGVEQIVWSRKIDYTDLPAGAWKFFYTDDVLLLPSEY